MSFGFPSGVSTRSTYLPACVPTGGLGFSHTVPVAAPWVALPLGTRAAYRDETKACNSCQPTACRISANAKSHHLAHHASTVVVHKTARLTTALHCMVVLYICCACACCTLTVAVCANRCNTSTRSTEVQRTVQRLDRYAVRSGTADG